MKTLLITAALILAGTAATAQGAKCATYEQVTKRLATKYGETRKGVGLDTSGRIVETFASGETGSWTIIVTNPGGLTCLVSSGQSYEVWADSGPVGKPT